MTIDAMENIAPEDWPDVLANLHRALRPGGHLYLTVEEHHDVDFPATHDVPCSLADCPPCPARSSTVTSPATTTTPAGTRSSSGSPRRGFTVVDEAYHQEDGWGYRHLLLQRPTRVGESGRQSPEQGETS